MLDAFAMPRVRLYSPIFDAKKNNPNHAAMPPSRSFPNFSAMIQDNPSGAALLLSNPTFSFH